MCICMCWCDHNVHIRINCQLLCVMTETLDCNTIVDTRSGIAEGIKTTGTRTLRPLVVTTSTSILQLVSSINQHIRATRTNQHSHITATSSSSTIKSEPLAPLQCYSRCCQDVTHSICPQGAGERMAGVMKVVQSFVPLVL